MSDYEELEALIDEIDTLLSEYITKHDRKFVEWNTKVSRFLIKKYGNESIEYNTFKRIRFYSEDPENLHEPSEDTFFRSVHLCKIGLNEAKATLNMYLEKLTKGSETMSNYSNLKQLTEEIDVLLSRNITSSDSDFRKWHLRAERFLSKCYGDNSKEYKDFRKTHFFPLVFISGTTEQEDLMNNIEACQNGLNITKDAFNVYLEEFEEEKDSEKGNNMKYDCNKVFIVHGHDDAAKQELARFLEKIKLEPIILHEQADKGLTIIEKIEDYSDVGYAIVLYTECDKGRAKEEPQTNERFRARQNVVFEHGFLIGKLGRKNVCALVKGNVETPGDISGIVYTPFDPNEGWKLHLIKNMNAAGYTIDPSLIL